MATFIPRTSFPAHSSLPRSYYLGHHAAGLAKMKTMLHHVDFVIECRDYRVPLTSRNPQFEEALAGWGKQRIIVYTKRDLGSGDAEGRLSGKQRAEEKKTQSLLTTLHAPSPTLFSTSTTSRSASTILNLLRTLTTTTRTSHLTPSHAMIFGLPNVGKSTLLNSLRAAGVRKKKASRTGAQPGVTRKIATGVKVIEGSDGWEGDDVYLVDTPGVFIPFVPDAEAMMKLALVGCVKDNIIPPYVLADYLLYQINLHDPEAYKWFHPPTNEIDDLLRAIAVKTGWKGGRGEEAMDQLGLRMVQKWRQGGVGRFLLDEVNEEAVERHKTGGVAAEGEMSLSQARKAEKEVLRQRARAKVKNARDAG